MVITSKHSLSEYRSRMPIIDDQVLQSRYTIDHYIDTVESFEAIRSDWERVYAADQQAQIFLSWTWLRGWLAQQPAGMMIAVVRYQGENPGLVADAGECVAFLPLRSAPIQVMGLTVLRRLTMLGNSGADYTGMLCLPEHEASVLTRLAYELVRNLTWDVLYLDDVIDPRVQQLVTQVQRIQRGISAHTRPGIVCPYLDLPETWEAYLQNAVSPSRRKKLRKALRDLETHPEVTIATATMATLDRDLDDFIQVYQLRWQRSPETLVQIRRFAHWCFSEGILWLFVVRLGDQPIAGEMLFIDRKNRAVRGYQRGYDNAFAKLSPGHGAVAYVIRQAIIEQLTMFDFLRGDEGYKAHFGTVERWNQHWMLWRNWRGSLYAKLKIGLETGRSSAWAERYRPLVRRLKQRLKP
jgi:CelD/BcsL family acetyltransferase involved in cellulose biosynthesis